MKQKSLYLAMVCLAILFSTSCQKEDTSISTDPAPVITPTDSVIIPTDPLVPLSYSNLNNTFKITSLPVITMEITTAQWNILLADFDINKDNEEYIMGSYSIEKDGVTTKRDSVGLRIRGNTSRRRPEGVEGEPHSSTNPNWNHASFTLSFSKYIKTQRYENLEKVNLKWFKDDANYVREVYCYDLFERYGIWTAPHSSYCRIIIKIKEETKPAYFGVYQMIESIDEDYLRNRATLFGSTTGNLWKCSSGANLNDVNIADMGVEKITLDPKTSKSYRYDLKTNKKALAKAQTQLSTFITELNSKSDTTLKTWLNLRMDVDLFLKTYAVNVMVGMWDDYWANSSNFYFYLDANNKFTFIPYDYDNTLGTSQIMADSGTQDMLRWGNDDCNPLVAKILSIPEFKAKYIGYLYELIDPSKNLFNSTSSINRIVAWQSMIAPYVTNDTGEDMVIGDEPASWGNQSKYRLNALTNNYFVIRANHLPAK